MDKNDKDTIREIVVDLMGKVGFECSVEIKDNSDDEGVVCDILVNQDSNLLIGHHGVNLESLQHLARTLVGKKTGKTLRFVIDVNSYRQEKNQSIIDYANFLAKQAVDEKRVVLMRPMNAYERRLVHVALEKNGEVVTESTGEREERRIVIKPANDIV